MGMAVAHWPVDGADGYAAVPDCAWLSAADAAEIAAEWQLLADAAGEPNPFYEPWYLLPSLEAFASAGTRLFVWRQGGRLAGLMPLTREARYGTRPIPHWAGTMHANIFLGAPLVRAGAEAEFWEALFAELDRRPGRGLFLHINRIAARGPLATALHAVAARQRRHFAAVWAEERALLEGPADPAAYLEAAVRGKKRKEYRRQRARLEEQGVVDVERLTGAEGLAAWCDEYLALEAAGWKGSQGSALVSSEQTERLFRSALAGAAAAERLDRLALRLDGRAIAMLVSFVTPQGQFSFKTAFDETLARFSPGVLLQIENLTRLRDPGFGWMDSCAAANHPMIDGLWTGRRRVERLSVAIGGRARRAAFGALVALETRRMSGSEG